MSKWQDQVPGGEKKTQAQPKQNFTRPSGAGFQRTAAGFGARKLLNDYGNGGEVFENFMLVAEESIPEIQRETPKSNFTVHRVMKEDFGLNYSGIVIANTEGDLTIFHVLMMEATGENPTPIERDFGGNRYTILRTAAQALDEKYMRAVEEVLVARLGVPRESLRSVDGTLVLREFNATDQHAIKRVIVNAVNAVFQETLVLVDNFLGVSLKSFNNHPDSRFALDVTFNNNSDMLHDITGGVIRKDIEIRLSTKIGQNRGGSINQGDVGEELIRIFGYVDFEYQLPKPAMAGQMPSSQCFMPNFVVTHFETDRAIMTPHLLVLGLASLVSISEDQTWIRSFIDQVPVKGKEINLNNIGMLNVQGNLSKDPSGFDKPLDTTDRDLGPSGIWNFISLLVKPKMMISIDIPTCGPNTWFLSVFRHIANGNMAARSRIGEAVNILVGGGYVDANVPMFISNTNKVHGGYYVEKGELFDIRRASSYLAYAAHVIATNQNPSLISRYVASWQNESVPADIRASERGKMIGEMVGNRMEVKQFYDRLTFNAQWLHSVVDILGAAGFRPVPENVRGSNYDMFQQRGVDYDQAGLDPTVRVTGTNDIFNGYHNAYRGYDRY